MVSTLKLGAEDFSGTSLKEKKVTLVLFQAAWCPFCVSFKRVFDRRANVSGLAFAEVDLSDMDNPLWETFDIQVVPTLILFKDGNPVERANGILTKGLTEKDLTNLIAKAAD